MKQLFAITALLTLLLLALPGFAQRRENKRNTHPISGRVLTVDAQKETASVVLFIYVADANAPGKVPAHVATRIEAWTKQTEQLEQRAAILQQQGNTEHADQLISVAEKFRKNIEEARHWREVSASTAADTEIKVIKRAPVDTIKIGTVVQFFAVADGKLPPAAKPQTVELNGPMNEVDAAFRQGETARQKGRIDPVQFDPIGPRAKSRPTPAATDKRMFRINGTITSLDPLTVQADGVAIQVTNTGKFPFVHREVLPFRDLKPGYDIMQAVIVTNGETEVTKIRSMVIGLPGKEKMPNNATGPANSASAVIW